MKSVIKRYENNPILRPEDMPGECFAVYNGGAIKIDDEYILLVRTEDTARKQWVYAARGKDGYNFTPDPKPVEFIAEDMDKYNKYAGDSFYDPRINIVEGQYYVTYAAYAMGYGCRIGIGETDDFKTVKHISFPHHVQNRNAVLFPRKFDGKYVMFHRPDYNGYGNIWISRSPDLTYWGDCEIIQDRNSGRWDSSKIGAGTPPLETSEGWLIMTHAVCGSCAGHYYTMGAILLDLEEPNKVIGYSEKILMCPEKWYETNGFVPNVVFPTGLIAENDGCVKIYYGAADNYECLAEANLSDLIESCLKK